MNLNRRSTTPPRHRLRSTTATNEDMLLIPSTRGTCNRKTWQRSSALRKPAVGSGRDLAPRPDPETVVAPGTIGYRGRWASYKSGGLWSRLIKADVVQAISLSLVTLAPYTQPTIRRVTSLSCIVGSTVVPILFTNDNRVRKVVVRVVENLPYVESNFSGQFRAISISKQDGGSNPLQTRRGSQFCQTIAQNM